MRTLSLAAAASLTVLIITSCRQSIVGAFPQSRNDASQVFEICSSLDITGVQWPPNMAEPQRSYFLLALNITGSFEGPDGWGNISGNFDKQGLSLGLLQQNLGQGSLQPLLISIRNHHPDVLSKIFSPEHLSSLLGMLANYEEKNLNDGESDILSILDFQNKSQKENDSVVWAKTTLYINGKFIPAWREELVRLARSPEYISLQFNQALAYYKKAVGYMAELHLTQLRSFLMMLDVVVQNGGFYSDSDIPDYNAYLKANPSVDVKTKLEKLLELRLRHVKPEYVEDVHSRKQTIIDGAGAVHSTKRDLEQQYCYSGLAPFS